MNDKVKAEGKPVPFYYDLGIHNIHWGHGDNRFLNHGTPGEDMVNPTQVLPVVDNNGRDVVFMVWQYTSYYLNVLKTFYPEGETAPFIYGPEIGGTNLFTSFHVT